MLSLSSEKMQFLEHEHFYTELTIHKLWDETLKIKRWTELWGSMQISFQPDSINNT